MEKSAALTPKKRKGYILFGIIAILVILRLALPYVVLYYANQKLATLDGHYGHIDDIDIALYRGAYVINDIYIDKVSGTGQERTKFFACRDIDLSVEWRALFEGKIVGEVKFDRPVLLYTMDKTVGEKAEKDTTDFIQLVKDFIPLNINRFQVDNGEIHYIDNGSSPKLDIPLQHLNVLGKGFTNESSSGALLPATLDIHAELYDGNIDLGTKLDPLTKIPTFDMNGHMDQTNLVYLNDFFKAYGNFDLKQGSMSMYTEFAAKDNGFKGYVKPLIKDLDIVQFNKEEGPPLQIAWEAFVGSVAEIFQNQRTDMLGAKIPVEGKFKEPETRTLSAIISVLKNAFIEALKPSIDNSININAVGKPSGKKKFFKELFNKGQAKKNK
jgi:hypothetical protein